MQTTKPELIRISGIPVKVTINRPPYQPHLSATERKAYDAAHRIISADFGVSHLASPGTRRSRTIDRIAKIIQEAFSR